jgi:hypothetical protein
MTPFKLSAQDATYLIALLEADRQTALQLLAADHFYQPSLLPRLKKFQQSLKREQSVKEARKCALRRLLSTNGKKNI